MGRGGNHEQPASWAPLLAALLFMAHPVQTEAVTYLCQRFTSMTAMFYLCPMVLYAKWRLKGDSGSRRQMLYWFALVTTLLSMFSKEISFTLPVMLVTYELFFFGWPSRRRLLLLIPFLATMLIIPRAVMSKDAEYEDFGRLYTSLASGSDDNSASSYLFTQFRVIITYLRLMLIPLGQRFEYDFPRYTSFLQGPVVVLFFFLSSLAGLAGWLYRKSVDNVAASAWLRTISFGICWFFITLSVESSIIPLRDLILEHRLYLPSVGFFLALFSLLGIVRKQPGKLGQKVIWFALLLLLGTFSFAAYERNELWREPVLLLEDNVRKSPNKEMTHFSLAQELAVKGRMAEAIKEYKEVLRITNYPMLENVVYLDLAKVYAYLGDTGSQRDIRQAHQALLERTLAEQASGRSRLNDWGVIEFHNQLAQLYFKQGDLDKAERYLRSAIALEGEKAVLHLNLAVFLKLTGRLDEAAASINEAARLDPENAAIQLKKGELLSELGRWEEAEIAFSKAHRLVGSELIPLKINSPAPKLRSE